MNKTVRTAAAQRAHATRFNYNKLQAVMCIASSAAVSIGLIYWAIKTMF